MASSQDLFSNAASMHAHAPLAERMRPRTLADVVGQANLLGPGKPLKVAFDSGRPHSMLFWGPPGEVKTTLARLMADGFLGQLLTMAEGLGGVNDTLETDGSPQDL